MTQQQVHQKKVTVTFEEAIADYMMIEQDCLDRGWDDWAERAHWAVGKMYQLRNELRFQYCTEDCAMEIFDAIEQDMNEIEEMLRE